MIADQKSKTGQLGYLGMNKCKCFGILVEVGQVGRVPLGAEGRPSLSSSLFPYSSSIRLEST
jgi:hypothetical protein